MVQEHINQLVSFCAAFLLLTKPIRADVQLTNENETKHLYYVLQAVPVLKLYYNYPKM